MWELIFLMVILKIPIVYLCWVVYWAIKAEPRPEEGAALQPFAALPQHPPWRAGPARRRHPRPGPHGGPTRGYARTRRAAAAHAAR